MNRNIIAILRGLTPEEAVEIGEVLIGAGIDWIEVPLSSPNPYDSIRLLARAYGTKAVIGAGTVIDKDHIAMIADAGGRLVVSPDCNPDVIRATKSAGLLSWPGVMTPTECLNALRAGADGLKLFPGSLIGPAGLAAMRAVLPVGRPIYAVGGVAPDNFREWKAAGVDGFGIGAALYRAGDSGEVVQNNAQAIVNAYDKALAL